MRLEPLLSKLILKQNLTEAESQHLFYQIFREKCSKAFTKAILLLLAKKGETGPEVAGCVRALKRLEPALKAGLSNVIDTCGTGGDGRQSINVSTLAAIVSAGAGAKVAKHGNRGLTSLCGSSDLMDALGVKLDSKPSLMVRAIKKAGIGYFHAPFYHPVFSRMQPLRKELKVRTVFNLLGPLVNPVGVKRQLVGVARLKYLNLYAAVLKRLGTERAFVCHSEDGLDEFSTKAATQLLRISGGRIFKEKLNPRSLGLMPCKDTTLRGGNSTINRKTALRLLNGKAPKPVEDLIVLNAAAALIIAGRANNFKEGIKLARQSIRSGQAKRALQTLIRISNSKP